MKKHLHRAEPMSSRSKARGVRAASLTAASAWVLYWTCMLSSDQSRWQISRRPSKTVTLPWVNSRTVVTFSMSSAYRGFETEHARYAGAQFPLCKTVTPIEAEVTPISAAWEGRCQSAEMQDLLPPHQGLNYSHYKRMFNKIRPSKAIQIYKVFQERYN